MIRVGVGVGVGVGSKTHEDSHAVVGEGTPVMSIRTQIKLAVVVILLIGGGLLSRASAAEPRRESAVKPASLKSIKQIPPAPDDGFHSKSSAHLKSKNDVSRLAP